MSKTPKCFFPNTPSSSTLQVITSFLSVLFLHYSLDNAIFVSIFLLSNFLHPYIVVATLSTANRLSFFL